MNVIAPKRVVLFGGSRDGLGVDVPVDATSILVPAFEPAYALARAVRDPEWGALSVQDLKYVESGRTNAVGIPIWVLAA